MDPENEQTPPETAPVETQTPPETVPVTEPGPAPWAADLATYIEDEAARAQADKYLREKWQPRTTQLEQELAESKSARELWKDLNDDPLGTFLAVASEMLGEDAADRIEQLIDAGFTPEQAAETAQQEQQAQPPAVDPELEEIKAERRERQQRELFDTELERIKTKPEAAGLLIDRSAIAPFVLQSDGDFDAALVGYKAYVDSLRQHYSPDQTPPPPPAPNVLGTQTGDAPPATPPTSKKYTWDNVDEALSDALDEVRANRQGPPTVGIV